VEVLDAVGEVIKRVWAKGVMWLARAVKVVV